MCLNGKVCELLLDVIVNIIVILTQWLFKFYSASRRMTTINDLTDDVLLLIFSLLSTVDVLQAALVCKRWADLIGSCKLVMDRLKMSCRMSKSSVLPYRTPTRNYRHVAVISPYSRPLPSQLFHGMMEHQNMMSSLHSYLTILEIRGVNLRDKDFLRPLSLCLSLTELKIASCQYKEVVWPIKKAPNPVRRTRFC